MGDSFLYRKRVVVVGLGASGVAAAHLCVLRGAHVIANDARPADALSAEARELANRGVEIVAGEHPIGRFTEADLVVVSPGVPRIDAIVEAERHGIPVWGEVELAVRSMSHPALVIAVGGTNGKSTTTSLVGAFLEEAGMNVFVGGNLGEPLAKHVDVPFDAVVLEVSSFQMERIEAFKPHVCALLNVTEDHLDRYSSFDEYACAKGNAFVRQTADDWAVVPAADATCFAQAKRGQASIVTFGPGAVVDVTDAAIIDRRTGDRFLRAEIALSGGHNASNVAAAIACAVPAGAGPDAIRRVLTRFRGLPHRTALVGHAGGVAYYDDSKGTNVGAAVTALLGLSEPRAVLIAGGRDKGGDYAPLVDALVRKGRAAVLIGEAADAIAHKIGDRVPVHRVVSMSEAVSRSAELAQPGDAVLLSPACSSFDMFRDYAHRGAEFVRAVHALPSWPRS